MVIDILVKLVRKIIGNLLLKVLICFKNVKLFIFGMFMLFNIIFLKWWFNFESVVVGLLKYWIW